MFRNMFWLGGSVFMAFVFPSAIGWVLLLFASLLALDITISWLNAKDREVDRFDREEAWTEVVLVACVGILTLVPTGDGFPKLHLAFALLVAAFVAWIAKRHRRGLWLNAFVVIGFPLGMFALRDWLVTSWFKEANEVFGGTMLLIIAFAFLMRHKRFAQQPVDRLI